MLTLTAIVTNEYDDYFVVRELLDDEVALSILEEAYDEMSDLFFDTLITVLRSKYHAEGDLCLDYRTVCII